MTGIFRPTGPIDPGAAPWRFHLGIGREGERGATAECFSALILFNSWSPRTTSATTLPSSAPCTSSVLAHCAADTFNKALTSSMLVRAGRGDAGHRLGSGGTRIGWRDSLGEFDVGGVIAAV